MTKQVRLPLSRFRAIAARYVLETADDLLLVEAADALLDAGIYTWSVGELATARQPPTHDARRLFELSLKELGIPLPSPEDAARMLARWYLYRAVEGSEPPFPAVVRLRDDLSYPLRFERALNNLEPQLRFINCWYRYEDLHEQAEEGFISREEAEFAAVELDNEFLEQARSWMNQDGPNLIDSSWLSWNGGIVSKLAQAIAEEKTWDHLPILADALEEAGCSDPEILEHCRAGESHGDCCWIIDSLLHKEAAKLP